MTQTRDSRLAKLCLLLGRLGLGYLFFSNLFWKLPPTFGCPQDFGFTATDAAGATQRTSGLCDWLGLQVVAASEPRAFFATDLDHDGTADLSLPVGGLVRANGAFVEQVVMPNIRVFGWGVFLLEAWIAASLLLGFLSRLGAFAAAMLAAQLAVGLGGVWMPEIDVQEWEWSYHLMGLLAVVMLGLAPGRILGIDAWLRTRWEGRQGLAGLLRRFT